LVAENTPKPGVLAISAPITASELPYIGDESTMRPPAATCSRRMSPRTRRSGESAAPTSNVSQVPSPMTGIASPVDGIGRE
jgi:hypothetical protein